MSVELKVKSKHLSEEARIIKFEERKQLKQYRWAEAQYRATGMNGMYPRWDDKTFKTYCSLNHHRKWDVRNENRATFLARAYLAGKDYKTVEHKCNDHAVLRCYILPRLCEMVNKYGPASQKLSKKWSSERKRYEYEPVAWKEFEKKILTWLEI